MGNALCGIGVGGTLVLPGFVRSGLSRRLDSDRILIGVHEKDPCLVAYDHGFAETLAADSERRRLAEEASDPRAHHARARRMFGFVAEAAVDARFSIALPAMMRRSAGVEGEVLLVGTGGAFEIWSPQAALASGDPILADLVAFHHLPHAA